MIYTYLGAFAGWLLLVECECWRFAGIKWRCDYQENRFCQQFILVYTQYNICGDKSNRTGDFNATQCGKPLPHPPSFTRSTATKDEDSSQDYCEGTESYGAHGNPESDHLPSFDVKAGFKALFAWKRSISQKLDRIFCILYVRSCRKKTLQRCASRCLTHITHRAPPWCPGSQWSPCWWKALIAAAKWTPRISGAPGWLRRREGRLKIGASNGWAVEVGELCSLFFPDRWFGGPYMMLIWWYFLEVREGHWVLQGVSNQVA